MPDSKVADLVAEARAHTAAGQGCPGDPPRAVRVSVHGDPVRTRHHGNYAGDEDRGDVDQTVFDWYPIRPGAPDVRRHRTGGGIRTRSHKRVEAIRWLICDAEVQQAIGRVRGVRRTADDSVLMIMLNRR